MAVSLPNNDDNDDHGKHDGADDVNKVKDLAFDWCLPLLRLIGQLGDATKDGAATSGDDNTRASARSAVGALEANILGLEIVLVGIIDSSRQREGFTCWIRVRNELLDAMNRSP